MTKKVGVMTVINQFSNGLKCGSCGKVHKDFSTMDFDNVFLEWVCADQKACIARMVRDL